ncbi:MAG: polysaccharide deacetylase family protein [Candidatus Omnitrophota bacterium]
MKKIYIISATLVIIWAVFLFLILPNFYVVPVLSYHGIGYGKTGVYVYTDPAIFKKQMDFIYNNHYKVISLDELVNGIKLKKKFDRKSVVITFDDGQKCLYLYAWPILKKYNFPATIFLISSFIGKEGFLNAQEIRKMHAGGITFGSHSKLHMYLPELLKEEDLISEIKDSRAQIAKITGIKVDYFCYPVGGFNDKIKKIVIDSSYRAACTTNRGRDKFNRDVFELDRIKMDNPLSRLSIWSKLSGYYNLFRSVKKSN